MGRSPLSEAARPQDLRARNSRMLLRALSEADSLTINEIASKTVLSRTAVQNILTGLQQTGMVVAGEKRNSTKQGGKRAASFTVCPEYKYSFFVCLSSDIIIVELNNFALECLSYRIEDASQFSYAELLEHIENLMADILSAAGLTKEDLYGIALAVSGTVDSKRGVLIDLTGDNSPGKWGTDLPIAEDLRSRLGFRQDIYLDNMCDFSGYDSYSFLAPAETRSCLYVLAHSRGIGATYINEGRIDKGAHGLIGEIGHTTIDWESRIPCRCGRTGCFEAMLYPAVIRRRVNEAISAGLAEGLQPDDIKSVDDLLRKANAGCPYAMRETERIGTLFGQLLYNVQIMTDPQCVIFHDSYSAQCELFHQSILSACSKKAEGHLKVSVRIIFDTATFSERGRKGAAAYLRNRYLDRYTEEL